MKRSMENNRNYLKMAELSERSGVSIPKIRYYIKKKILPEPIRIKQTSAYYSSKHVERLKVLKEMHEKKNVPISVIKKMIDSIEEGTVKQPAQSDDPSQIIQNQIIDSSVSIFRKKGYERATIADISGAAGISRNTFYQYFENKKELFIACLTKLFVEWRRKAPDETTPIPEAMKSLALSFYKVFPRWIDMMNLFRSSATKYPADFADRLEQSLESRIRPIALDIEKGIKKGLFREVNKDLAALTLAGQLEYIFYFMSRGRFGDKEPVEVIDLAVDIFFHGIMKERG
jgi:AcrR family transcriptional regulator/predicted DNA-binding transcriptional regulator AlpA